MLRAIDLCAGAGGLSLGLGWAGFSVYGVEIDPGACKVHEANVGACHLGGMEEFHPPATAALVAGGVPCQSFSRAGKRKGLFDPRGQLYRHLIRIAIEAEARAGRHAGDRLGMRLSPEQAAILQGFPPAFRFLGTKKEQYRAIGNAVPPPLAAAVGASIMAFLRRHP